MAKSGKKNKIFPKVFKLKTLDEGQVIAKKIVQELSLAESAYVGLNELIINAIEHGNLDIDFEAKTRFIAEGRWLEELNQRLTLPQYKLREVEVILEEDHVYYIITIKDQGTGFDWLEYTDNFSQTSFSKHGRGIIIAQLISFDKLEYVGNGNCVRCYVKK